MDRQYKRYGFIRELVHPPMHQRRQFLGRNEEGGCAPLLVAFDASL